MHDFVEMLGRKKRHLDEIDAYSVDFFLPIINSSILVDKMVHQY